MAVELLSYFYGDARTLTYTAYTFGRGFADAHRRFAQAFLALPAVRGNVILGTDSNAKVRTYNTTNGTYIGIALKAYTNNSALSIQIPGAWNSKMDSYKFGDQYGDPDSNSGKQPAIQPDLRADGAERLSGEIGSVRGGAVAHRFAVIDRKFSDRDRQSIFRTLC